MTGSEDFGKAVADALDTGAEAEPREGAPSEEEGNKDPAGLDTEVAKLAADLVSQGIKPEQAREAVEALAYLRTPEGQKEWMTGFLNSSAGKPLKEAFGKQQLSELLSAPGGPQRIAELLKEWGVNTAPEENADLSPEDREAQAIRNQMVALQRRLEGVETGSAKRIGELEGRLQSRDALDQRKQEFVAWAGERPPMSAKAYAAIGRRAHELASLYPQRYPGTKGFRQAASDALSEKTTEATLFAPKPRPRGLPSQGGGVAGKTKDVSKLSLDEQIAAAAEDYAEAVTGRQE